jgi:hypothetical protein
VAQVGPDAPVAETVAPVVAERPAEGLDLHGPERPLDPKIPPAPPDGGGQETERCANVHAAKGSPRGRTITGGASEKNLEAGIGKDDGNKGRTQVGAVIPLACP